MRRLANYLGLGFAALLGVSLAASAADLKPAKNGYYQQKAAYHITSTTSTAPGAGCVTCATTSTRWATRTSRSSS